MDKYNKRFIAQGVTPSNKIVDLSTNESGYIDTSGSSTLSLGNSTTDTNNTSIGARFSFILERVL